MAENTTKKTVAVKSAQSKKSGAKTTSKKPTRKPEDKKAILKKERPMTDDDYGLKLFLQPIYCPKEKRVFGYECMPRIVDRELGVLTPGMFLDVAKKNPMLLNGLENWTLAELFKIALQFRQKRKYIEMLSLNLDLTNMSRKEFVDRVKSFMDKHTESIYFELDEDVFFSKDPIVVENVQKLRELEIGIGVNDFSSDLLTYDWGETLPFDIIKIDKTYIDLFLVSPKARAIMEKMVEFARERNVVLVAVGVENAEQEKALLELGIEKMQGFYYAKPMNLGIVLEDKDIPEHKSMDETEKEAEKNTEEAAKANKTDAKTADKTEIKASDKTEPKTAEKSAKTAEKTEKTEKTEKVNKTTDNKANKEG